MSETSAARARMASNVVEAVYRCAEDVLGKAQRLAPVEEGTLRGSAALALIVNGTRHEGLGALAAAKAAAHAAAFAHQDVHVEAEVSFNTVYAARQHEETSWQHPKGGQAKYLEQPFRESLGRYGRLIERASLLDRVL